MSDLISRKAAVDAITKHVPYVSLKRAEIILEDVPSAHCDYCPYPDDYDGRIQVVRCKDCKHYEADIMGNPWGVCCHPDWITDNCGNSVDESGWCYRAERRTDE